MKFVSEINICNSLTLRYNGFPSGHHKRSIAQIIQPQTPRSPHESFPRAEMAIDLINQFKYIELALDAVDIQLLLMSVISCSLIW